MQQEEILQSTPLQSRLAPHPPGAVQPAQSITASGRKRPRHSLSPADNSSAGEQSALYQQGNSDGDVEATSGMQRRMALAQEHSLERDSILYQEGLGNYDRDLPSPSMERSVIPAHAVSPFEPLSRSASASDENFSRRLEQSGCTAVMAARTVAQVMGMQAGQARLQSELKVGTLILWTPLSERTNCAWPCGCPSRRAQTAHPRALCCASASKNADHFTAVQTMEGDRVALEIQHHSTVARLEESLQENNNLHSVMLEQAGEVSICSLASLIVYPEGSDQ